MCNFRVYIRYFASVLSEEQRQVYNVEMGGKDSNSSFISTMLCLNTMYILSWQCCQSMWMTGRSILHLAVNAVRAALHYREKDDK